MLIGSMRNLENLTGVVQRYICRKRYSPSYISTLRKLQLRGSSSENNRYETCIGSKNDLLWNYSNHLKVPLSTDVSTKASFSSQASTFEIKRRTLKRNNRQLVTLTSGAIEQLHKIVQNTDNIVKLYFVVKGCNGYSYEMELVDKSSLDPMDEIIKDSEGKAVLAVENKASFHLLGCNIDYQVTHLEEGFVFDNPNVKSKCGCGQSFQF